MGLKKSLEGHFSGMSDARCACDVEIPLIDILFVLMFGVLAGYDNTEDIKNHADYFRDDLRQRFGVTRIPSESTLRRMLRLIRPEELGKATLQLMQEAFSHLEGDVIAIDGKAIRGSTIRGRLASQLRILSAYDTQLQMTIGSVEVGEKTNEIPGMLDVLPLFNFSGRIITADAMHCQKDTCRAIVSGDGDYVFQVKRNQKDLYEGVKDSMDHLMAEPEEGLQVSIEDSVGHGRIERRTCYLFPIDGWYDRASEWPGVQSMVAVVRETERDGHVTVERAYYITSLLGTAAHLNRIVRDHWKIESMHWSLDVTFDEDACRITDRNTQLNLNILRKLALALHSHWAAKAQEASGKSKKPRLKTSIQQIVRGDMKHLGHLLAPCIDLEAVFEKH